MKEYLGKGMEGMHETGRKKRETMEERKQKIGNRKARKR